MNRIWAPWRLKYVQNIKKGGCLFCRVQRSKNDSKNRVVFRSSHCFVILNTFPYNNGHLMIVPYRHIADPQKLSDAEVLDMNKTLNRMVTVLKKVLKPSGFNIGLNIGKYAGAGIEQHIHTHVVPRWIGDTNFMPVLSDARVIPQSLDALYRELRKHLKNKK